jgi:hypothetical protein
VLILQVHCLLIIRTIGLLTPEPWIYYLLFSSFVDHISVKLPNGASIPIKYKGTIHVNSYLILHNVLFVPAFSFSLISLSQLTKQLSRSLIFKYDFCVIQATALEKKIELAKQSHGLYHLDVTFVRCDSPPSAVVSSSIITNFHNLLWHYRLDHLSLSPLRIVHNVDSVVTLIECDFHFFHLSKC